MVSILASGPSGPGFESQLLEVVFYKKNPDVAVLIDSTLLMQWTVKKA